MRRVAIVVVGAVTLGAQSSLGIKFASPLQTLTIFDEGLKEPPPSPRQDFLEKYKAGLEAEAAKKDELQQKYDEFLARQDTESPEWARKAAAYEQNLKLAKDRVSAKAFDETVKQVEQEQQERRLLKKLGRQPSGNKYQFVGVINKNKPSNPIEWYARKKPKNSDWSVRLVHVNKRAIIKDLFNRGKVDIMANYHNTGEADLETNERIVEGQYDVKERSWRTLWNFSPKHFITDSSGMYWRDRRVRPGVFTDGATVYETAYRYKDGKNGIRALGPLDSFLEENPEEKNKILKKIEVGNPDLVFEM